MLPASEYIVILRSGQGPCPGQLTVWGKVTHKSIWLQVGGELAQMGEGQERYLVGAVGFAGAMATTYPWNPFKANGTVRFWL